MKDDVGRDVDFSPPARRVVTIAPNVTELAFAVKAGNRVVGTDDFSDFPAEAAKLPKVGAMEPNLESIARLEPDLVFASTSANRPGLAEAMREIHIPLYVVKTERLSQIAPAAARIAGILGGDASIAATIEKAIAAQKRVRPKPPRVLFLLWPNPLYVAGHDTFIDDLLTLTGAVNAVPPTVKGWPQYSLEALIANPPDLILFPSKSVNLATLQKQLSGDSRTATLEVLHDGLIIPVDENRFTRPGPRVAEAAAELNAILDGLEFR
ncbi:MAG TPA: helical backbone metal receptor [Thermoanaerobaculia bacterium]|nr:helical backbone metal receptor [Thermoanaerobaculia bacterium]